MQEHLRWAARLFSRWQIFVLDMSPIGVHTLGMKDHKLTARVEEKVAKDAQKVATAEGFETLSAYLRWLILADIGRHFTQRRSRG